MSRYSAAPPTPVITVSVPEYVTCKSATGATTVAFTIQVSFGPRTRWAVRRTFEEFEQLHAWCGRAFDEDAPLPYFPASAADMIKDAPGGLRERLMQRSSAASSTASSELSSTICLARLEGLRAYLVELVSFWPTWTLCRSLASGEPLTAPLPHPDPRNPSTVAIPLGLIDFLAIATHVDCGAAYRAIAKSRADAIAAAAAREEAAKKPVAPHQLTPPRAMSPSRAASSSKSSSPRRRVTFAP